MRRPYKRILAYLLIFSLFFTMNISVYATDASEDNGEGEYEATPDNDDKTIIDESSSDDSADDNQGLEGETGDDTGTGEQGKEEDKLKDVDEDIGQDEEKQNKDVEEGEEEDEEEVEDEIGEEENEELLTNPQIEILATPHQSLLGKGDVLSYEIFIKNIGDVDLEGLVLSDRLNSAETIDKLEIGEELLLERQFQISDEYEEEYLENMVSIDTIFEEKQVYAESSFTIMIGELEDGEGLLEYYPQVDEPEVSIPLGLERGLRNIIFNSIGLQDTIEVNKEAERLLGLCRTFEVMLKITGTPQQAPVDVVLVIDRSGSMNESSSSNNEYFPIVATPADNGSYYVRVNNSNNNNTYQLLTRHSGSGANSIWKYGSGNSTRYVKWDPNGNTTAGGGNSANSAVGKPFLIRGNTRLYFAKKAAINFAYRVLGPAGIPGSRVSIVSFAGPTAFGNTGHDGEASINQSLTNNLADIQNKINAITADGGTNTQAGYRKAKQEIQDNGNINSSKVVIMFTDGMPNASTYGATLQAHENVTSATIHTNAAIEAAGQIFNANPPIADVYSIGLFQGISNNTVKAFAISVLTEAQNKGFYEAPTALQLEQIFDDIATNLGYAASNAKVVDKLGDNFDLVAGTLPAGATYDPDTREITWNPGTIHGDTTLKYQVRAKSSFLGGPANTNEYASLSYTDIFGTPNKSKTFPVPNVDVPTLLEVSLGDITIALGQSGTLGLDMAISGGDGDGNYTYEWRKLGEATVISTAKNPVLSPTVDTQYELTVTDSNGCKGKTTMWVRIQKGSITITKVVNDLKAKDTNRKFDITVVGPNGRKWTVRLKHNESKTIGGLEVGNYSISETVPMNFELVGISTPTMTITQQNLDGSSVVTNKRNNDGWFYDEDERENKFKVGIVVVQRLDFILEEGLEFEKEDD